MSGTTRSSDEIIKRFFEVVVDPIVAIIFAAAILYFAFGVFQYIRSADDPAERAKGGKHILYSTLGLFIMISVWGIIQLLQNTIG